MSEINKPNFWIDLIRKILVILLKPLRKSSTHNQHVVPHENGWAVRGAGNERVTSVHDTQAEAIERARDIALNYRSDVIIHRSDGTIRDRQSYR